MNVRRQEVADRLHSAAIHLVRTASAVDAHMGLSAPRASAMSVLVFGGPRTIGALARIEGVRSPTMTALVNGLEADGMVRRRPDPHDARQVTVVATAKGRRRLQQGRRRRVEHLSGLLAGCSDAELALLEQAAELINRAVSVGPRAPDR
jgi:DNA-binding MarR family transcriptional regulator